MKYLDNSMLLHLSNSLSSIRTPETRIHVRFEAYSVKPMRNERKLYKEMEEAYMSGQEEMEEMSFSPEMREAGLSSCFGRLDEKESRKVHFLLVSTLNTAFPYHDFHSLQPNQFTRERSAAAVLSSVTTSLLGPGTGAAPMIFSHLGVSPPQPGTSAPAPASLPASGSPSTTPNSLPNPHIYRVLNEAVSLDDAEVYSWFPEPEYDPHFDADDGEITEDGLDDDSESSYESVDQPMNVDVDMEAETPASWGAGGMELDDVPESPAAPLQLPKEVEPTKRKKRNPDLLWSQNYFFYSKRQKRILFLSCWCRKRPSQFPPPPEQDDGTSFPLPISSSFTPAPPIPQLSTVQARSTRIHRPHNRFNAKPSRKTKLPVKSTFDKESSTIPIRGMETPKPVRAIPGASRLASSAPAQSNISPQAALAKMSTGGFKPRQTPARALINAAVASTKSPAPMPPPSSTLSTREQDKTRKERSKSRTPGGTPLTGMGTNLVESVAATKGKRVKV